MVNGVGGSKTLSIQNILNKNLKEQGKSIKALSSGIRQDIGAAANAIIKDAEATVAIFNQASRNIGDAGSALAIADGSLSQIGDANTRLQELATQAANGTLSDAQRGALADEFNALVSEIDRTAQTTEFNGNKLLTQDSSFTVQVGKDSSDNSGISVGTPNITSSIDSIKSLDISTQAGAQSALSSLSDFSKSISQNRGKIGSDQARLDLAKNNAEQASLTHSEAAASIRDADIAEETSRYTNTQIRTQISSSLLQKESTQTNLLKLLA